MSHTNSHSPSQKRAAEQHDKTAAPALQAHATVSHEAIAKRAYEIYLRRSSVDGQDEADWLAAERELTHK